MEEETRCGQIHHYNALQLAYVGDSVFDLLVRSYQLSRHDGSVKSLHAKCVACVNAAAQAETLRNLQGHLTEEEAAVVQRGRNGKPHSLPKHADPADYALATALEALFGYLYLENKTQRIQELFSMCTALWENREKQES